MLRPSPAVTLALGGLPLVVIISLFAVLPASAQWTPEGVVLNSRGRAILPAVIASDGAGGAIVAWIGPEEGADPDGLDIYAQRITADGRIAPGWPHEGLPVAVGLGFQEGVRIASDGAGGAYIVWQDSRDYFVSGFDCYVQRVTASGSIAPGWPVNGIPLAIVPGEQINPEIAPDGAGGVYVVWEDHRRDPGYPFGQWLVNDFYAHRITSEGKVAPGWPVDGLPICIAPDVSIRTWLDVMADGAGGLYAAWWDTREIPPFTGAYVVRVRADGTLAPGWIENGKRVSTNLGGATPMLAPDGEGGFIVAARDRRLLASMDVYAQRMTGAGDLATGWPSEGVLLSTAYDDQELTAIVPDDAGGAIALWTDYRNYFPNAADVYGHHIRGDGTLAPSWPADGAPFATSNAFETADVNGAVADGAGGVLLAFEFLGERGYDTYVQHITADGVPASGWPAHGAPLKPQRDGDGDPAAVSDGIGGMLVAWHSQYPGGPGGNHIRVQRVTGDCPTVPSLSVELRADPPVVALPAQSQWVKLRLEPPSPHTTDEIDVASLRLNGTSMVDPATQPRVTDADGDGLAELTVRFLRGITLTPPAGEDSLLLRVTGKLGEECLFGVTRVRVVGHANAVAEDRVETPSGPPPSDELTISPLPARARFTLRFYQREEGIAQLALYDLAGRRVENRVLPARTPGWQREPVELPSHLGPGIYFLSLDDARGTRTQRVVVAR